MKNITLTAPIFVYMYLKENYIKIDKTKFLKINNLERSEFGKRLLKLSFLRHEYRDREKIPYIINSIKQIKVKFSLNTKFLLMCEEIYKKYYLLFQNTTQNMTVAVISILAILVLNNPSVLYSKISSFCNTSPGALHNFIKHKIISEKFQSNFSGVISSKDLILNELGNISIPKLTLSENKIKRIQKLYLKGMKIEEIGSKFNVSKKIINLALDFSNFPLKKNSKYKQKDNENVKEKFPNEDLLYRKLKTITKCIECNSPLYLLKYKDKGVLYCKTCNKEMWVKKYSDKLLTKQKSDNKEKIWDNPVKELNTTKKQDMQSKGISFEGPQSISIKTQYLPTTQKVKEKEKAKLNGWTTKDLKILDDLEKQDRRKIIKLHLIGLTPDKICKELKLDLKKVILALYDFNKSIKSPLVKK